MKTKQLLALFVWVMISSAALVQAQEAEQPQSINDGTLEDQFNYMFDKSSRYQEYKVVKMEWLNAYQAHVMDSLAAVRKELASTRDVVTAQKNQIEGLQADLKTVNDKLTAVTREKDSIGFLGISMNKSAYHGLVWTIIFALIGVLGFFVYKYKESHVITSAAQKALQETEDVFEAYKKRAREREQKIMRQLQDELNKAMG